MTSYITDLKKYRNHVNFDEVIDSLISSEIIGENDYREIWNKVPNERVDNLFIKVHSKGNRSYNAFIKFLSDKYPNVGDYDDEHDSLVALARGGFPVLPLLYIKRSKPANELKGKLIRLQYNRRIVVHGMLGYGKSSLVNEVLTEKQLLRDSFDNIVFWINLGTHEHYVEENVAQDLWRLYVNVQDILNESPVTHCPDLRTLKDLLIKKFQILRLKNALLILDDACNKDVLTAFELKCKTVITTQHKNIVPEAGTEYVEVKTGFTKSESLDLLAKSIEIDVGQLCPEALQVHEICKGHPMIMSHVASYLHDSKELAIDSPSIWNHVIETLSKGKYELNEWMETQTEEKIFNAIQMCISKLPEKLRKYYSDLAIFLPDVNIVPNVLQIMWGVDKFQIHSIMNEFAKRSLIVSFYNKGLKTYVYGIHDLHLNFLKKHADNITDIHRKLIKGYDKLTGDNYAKLPTDNYTLHFIGYHLHEAQEFEKFRVYFELEFIEAKIKAAGPGDVIFDMKTYEKYITKEDPQLESCLKDLKSFIECFGPDIYNFSKTDIIQYALQERQDSFVYKEALKLASLPENLTRVYFNLPFSKDKYNYSQAIKVSDHITVACYAETSDEFYFATSTGDIKLFSQSKQKVICEIGKHELSVNILKLSLSKKHLLSISDDKTMKVWDLSRSHPRRSLEYPTNGYMDSPKEKQEFWKNFHTEESTPHSTYGNLEHSDYIICAAFSQNFNGTSHRLIATGTQRGYVIIWDNKTQKQMCHTGARGSPSSSVAFSKDNSQVLFSNDESVMVWDLVLENSELQGDLLYNRQLLSKKEFLSVGVFMNSRDVITVGDKGISLWNNFSRNKLPTGPFIFPEGTLLTFAVITENCKYLIISTDQQSIIIWDIDEHKIVNEVKIDRGLAKSLDTLYDENSSVNILLISSDKKTIQQCHVQPKDSNIPNMTNLQFSSHWHSNHPLIAISGPNNQIRIHKGYNLISECKLSKGQLRSLCFSICGNNVLCGMDDGMVLQLTFKSRRIEELMDLSSPVVFLRCFEDDDNPLCLRSNGSRSNSESEDNNNGVVIAAAENGRVMMLRNDVTFAITFEYSKWFFYHRNKLVVVDRTGFISVCNVVDRNCFYSPERNVNYTASTAKFCDKKYLVAVTRSSQKGNVLDVYDLSERMVRLKSSKKLEDTACSSCFSFDGSFLAVGYTSGTIEVWETNEELTKLAALPLHETPVKYLLFSAGLEPILASLAEQVAFWDIRKFKKKRNTKKLQLLSSPVEEFCSMSLSYWADKQSSPDYLLACIKLHHHYSNFISASREFTSFFIVDDKGKIYILEAINHFSYS